MKSTKLQRDILRWEYENETKNMYSPPSPIEWLENKLIELRKHIVMCDFHCERFEFGRDKKCEQQCSDCHWMQTKSQ